MSYVHHCNWCGWRRDAASPTLLAPHCPDCGCLLETVPAGEFTGEQLHRNLALHAASMFYGLGVRIRNRAFDLGLKKAQRVDVPVISLGNLTTGGTGKTPFAAFIARW